MTIFTKLCKRDIIIEQNGSKIIKLCTKELKENYDFIKKPLIQTYLRDDKVDDIHKLYKDDGSFSHHFLSCSLITIAYIKIDNVEEYYLVDGQHRINAAIKLYDMTDGEDNKIFLVSIIKISDENELNQLYLSINQDSHKIYPLPPLPDIFKYASIKKNLRDNYEECLPKKVINTVYTVDEIIENITKTDIYNKYSDITQICQLLKKKEKKFFKEVGYKEFLCKNTDKFKKSESTCINNNCCMFLKKNNFFEWLSDSTIKPRHEINDKPNISKKLKDLVWLKDFESYISRKCPIIGCTNIMDKTIHNSWHCGYITSYSHGGETELVNLKVLCTDCNKKINNKNLYEYQKEFMNQTILDNYFEDSEEIMCMYKSNCKNIINNNTFCIWSYKTKKGIEKIKPICNNCNNKYN